MAKRYYPQQQGDRKKAKLDISISDHNFPLSQNNEFGKETNDDDNWGDDNDDEILLLASQACEEAYSSSDISQVPDYSMCMQPGSTSTQLTFEPTPSTSKTEFTFKKPSFNPPTAISTHLKEKCNRISSPLPGISSKVIPKTNGPVNMTEDLIFSDKVFKSNDSEQVYKQLLQMQEENAKLKSENGKLLEKCVTKEGEASILRTQLKSCQMSVDNARLEKIKAQEKVQMEWQEKLSMTNSQMHDLRTQLDFKNLEIISIKEKCKKLESTKVRLTQVTVGPNDIYQSHRQNNNTQNDSLMTREIIKRVKTASNAVQTDEKAHTLILNKTCRLEPKTQASILSHILEPSINQHHSILDYNEKLQKTTDLSQNKCRIYSTFHRLPTTPVPKETDQVKVVMNSLYEDVTCVVMDNCERIEERYFNIFNSIKSLLNETRSRLDTVSQRVTTSFQKEMDEKYMEVTSNYQYVSKEDLLKGRPLFKEEQEILSRRMVATLSYVLESSKGVYWFFKHKQNLEKNEKSDQFIDIINRICILLDNASCATLYSGLLLSITYLIESLLTSEVNKTKVLQIIKTILMSRPMPFVITRILDLVRTVSLWDDFVNIFCPGNGTGNLKTDYDQGVLLYKKDSCFIQVLLKQVEACLKCIEKQKLADKAVQTTQHLIILYSNISDNTTSLAREKSRCDCHLVLVQVIVYALRICAVMLDNFKLSLIDEVPTKEKQLLSVCRCGIRVLYQCAVRDVEFSTQLSHNEGLLIEFCELMRGFEHSEAYTNMLSELAGTLQSSPEDMPPSFHRQPWLKSFESFSLLD